MINNSQGFLMKRQKPQKIFVMRSAIMGTEIRVCLFVQRLLIFATVILIIAGEPYTRQQTVLCTNEKKPKFVGCKIRSMRSRLVFLLSGIFTPVRQHVKHSWTRSIARDFEYKISRQQADYKRGKRLAIVFFFFSRCLYLLLKVSIKVSIQWVLDLGQTPNFL